MYNTIKMENWIRLWLFIAAFVLKDAIGCPDPGEVETLNAIAHSIMELSEGLPRHDFSDPEGVRIYNDMLGILCTDFRDDITTIAFLLAECPELSEEAHDLNMLIFLERNYTELASHFTSVDELCDACAPFLVSAWMVEEFVTAGDSRDVFLQIANATDFCTNHYIPAALDQLVNGQNVCPPLWREAGLPSPLHINDINQFTDEICESAIEGTQCLLDCIEAEGAAADFVECIENTNDEATNGTIESQFCDSECCGKRECVKQYFDDTCGILGRDLYIAAVNFDRNTSDYIVSLYTCVTGGAIVTRMSVVAALAMTFIILLFSYNKVSPA